MNVFKYCPNCKSGKTNFIEGKKFLCSNCGFEYYHNVAVGAGVIIECDGKILLTRRAENPGKGKLDVPGGFIDPNESAQQALHREVYEEIGIKLGQIDFFNSFPNIYEYKGIKYNVCDIFFTTKITKLDYKIDSEEISEVLLLNPEDIDVNEIGFPSVRKVVKEYLDSLKKR